MRPDWICDSSTLKAFRQCNELVRLRYGKGLRKAALIEAAPASGTAWDRALQCWFRDEGYDKALAALRSNWFEDPSMFELPDAKRPLSLYERLLEAYCEKYPREQDQFKVLGTQVYLEQPEYCGLLDLPIEFPDGSIYVQDHKSTSAWLSDAYFEKFIMDDQVIGYVWLAQKKYGRCDGFYIDVVHVDTRYHKVKPDKDFVRYGPIKVPQWRIDNWYMDMIYDSTRIKHMSLAESWPRNGQACFNWNRRCPMWALCTAPPELRAGIEEREYEVKHWKPKELANAKQ